MIPKIIHYCWFGRKKKPKDVVAYIESWKKKLPEYQFIEWNEDNFDITKDRYTKEAYEAKKYAFVSDVARVRALYEYGGVYLDTDVEIKRDFSKLLCQYDLILGYEYYGKHLMTAFMAANKGNDLMKKLIELYSKESFIKEDGTFNEYPNTYRITDIFVQNGVKLDGNFQEIGKIVLFPEKSFSAMNFSTMSEISDESTYTVHHFKSSWKPWYVRVRRKIKFLIGDTIFGERKI